MNKIKPCPFCGTKVELSKRPLWHENHGYINCFEFKIVCPKCGCNITYSENDTIYRTKEEAIQNVIKAWNKRDESNNTVTVDKIRTEIDSLKEGISSYHNDRPWLFKDEVLQIIDKYKAESEG